MARKTNKTSHVLNLITNGAPAEPEENAAKDAAAGNPDTQEENAAAKAAPAEASSQTNSEAAQAAAPVSPQTAPVTGQTGTDKKVIVVDDSDSDKISEEIKGRLEEHLEQSILRAAAEEAEKAGDESEPEASETALPDDGTAKETEGQPEGGADGESQEGIEPAPVVSDSSSDAGEEAETELSDGEAPLEEEPQESAGHTEESTAEPESEEMSAPDNADSAVSPPAQEEASAPGGGDTAPDREIEYHMLNVVEKVLERARLRDQMKRYDVCTCSRCYADVMALCLTALPPKYVVVDGTPTAPIIGYYESRNRARIITEVMKACILVKEKPRHKDYEITGDVLR